MSPTRRMLLKGITAAAAASVVPVAVAAQDDGEARDRAIKAFVSEHGGRRRECRMTIELGVRVLAENGRLVGEIPAERTAYITQYGDGSGRISVWGPDGLVDGYDGSLTPETKFVETYVAAADFAPLAFALFDSVEGGQMMDVADLIHDHRRRRRTRIW